MADVPGALREGRRALENLAPEVLIVEDWQPSEAPSLGAWRLLLELSPAGMRPYDGLPTASRWYFFASADYPEGGIHILPAKDGGTTLTFAHQQPFQATPTGYPWNWGGICVVESTQGHDLVAARYDPRGADERLAWYARQALAWLVAASTDNLIPDGAPFELPFYPPSDTERERIVFSESETTFRQWEHPYRRVGYATLTRVNPDGDPGIWAASDFRTLAGRAVANPTWGPRIAEGRDRQRAAWVLLAGPPVLRPWRAPSTWGEMREAIANPDQTLNRLSSVIDALRPRDPLVVLLGFPMPLVGRGPEVIVHWLAVRVQPPPAGGRAGRPPRTERERRNAKLRDGPLAHARPVAWMDSANWHPSQLGTRGRLGSALRSRRILLLGAGSLGSIVAELLVRAGARQVFLMDHDVVEAGNLVRHTAGVADIGYPKSYAVSKRLLGALPHADVVGLEGRFPGGADLARVIPLVDLVVDTTASDDVAAAMAAYPWPRPIPFAVFSFSYGARRLYAYVARGDRLPGMEYREAVAPWIARDEGLTTAPVWEGAGCRFPVFPARADDVAALAALAVRDLDNRIGEGPDGLRVFERSDDGTISLLDRPADAE